MNNFNIKLIFFKNFSISLLAILVVGFSSSTHALQYIRHYEAISIDSGYTQMLLPSSQGWIKPISAYNARYPSVYHNMQFIAFRNPSTGQILYVQTKDPDGQVIDWEVVNSGSYSLKLGVYTLTGAFPSNFYITDTTMTAATDTEFYRKVARKYRAWAINQKWAKRKASKFDSMVTMAMVPDLRTDMMNNHIGPFINNWSGEDKACWVTFWRRWWQLGLDGGLPDYQTRNEPQSFTSISWMAANKCSPFPYTNAFLWDSNNINNPNYTMTPEYGTDGKLINNTEPAAYNEIIFRNPSATYTNDVAQSTIKSEAGVIEAYPNRPSLKFMCQKTSKWKTTFQNAAQGIANDGWKGIYYDMAAFTAPKLCYDDSHGHDKADPLVWQNGIRDILTTMHATNATKDLMVFTEGNAEIYMDLVDAFLSYNDTGLGAASGTQVPLFKEVYGDIARFISWQALPVSDPKKTINDLTPQIMSKVVRQSANFGSMFYGAPYFMGWGASYDIQEKLRTDASYADTFDLINNPQYKKVYERGGGAINWTTSGAAPTPVNIVDTETGTAAVQFGMINRDAPSTNYQLNINSSGMSQVSWDMKMNASYYIIVTVAANDGNWYNLLYDQNARDFSDVVGATVKFGLGADTIDGKWRTIRRDVANDLYIKTGKTLTSVVKFWVLGTGLIDNITLSGAPNVYADGTSITGWTMTGAGLILASVTDNDTSSSAVQLSGITSRDAGKYFTKPLNDNQRFEIAWDMKTSMSYYALITVAADDGNWYNLLYDPNASNFRQTVGGTVKIGLGTETTDGKWRTFRRNLADDLYEGTKLNITSVISFNVYATGSVDNILLWGNGIRTSGR